ncbi:UNVERIFIED_CONTAM: topi [Trichonephila clavipes]
MQPSLTWKEKYLSPTNQQSRQEKNLAVHKLIDIYFASVGTDLFTSESDSQLFPSYDLFSRSYGFDYDEGQTITQPPLPVSENTNQSNLCCEFCSKVFYRKRYLLDHLNIHTGERPYICEFCTKSFTQRASRNRHMKLCHPELLEASKLSASVGDSVSKK